MKTVFGRLLIISALILLVAPSCKPKQSCPAYGKATGKVKTYRG